jgi:hypothetical protein
MGSLLLGVLGSTEVDDQGVARGKRYAVERDGVNKPESLDSILGEDGLTSRYYARH